MTKFILTATNIVLVGVAAFAQPAAKRSDLGVYAIPYASESNAIELEVVNSTGAPLKDVSVQLGVVPTWLSFEETSAQIGALKAGGTQTATFTFDLDEKAPVGEIRHQIPNLGLVTNGVGLIPRSSIAVH